VAAGAATTVAGSVSSISLAEEFTTAGRMIEPEAGTWKTWVLSSGDQLRPPQPPDDLEEIAKVEAAVRGRTPEMRDRISYWDAGSPGYRWNQIAMQETNKALWGPGLAYRAMAILDAAIYDGVIAAWDAKFAYGRPRPAELSTDLSTAIATPNSPSYPCAHAVTAGAASAVLEYLFPDSSSVFADLAIEAAESRVHAGVAFPSDIDAGLDLGRKVGALFVEWAKADGSDADADFDPSTLPTGPGLWTGEPAYPTLGNWKTWVIPDGTAFRPAPPPAWDSPERQAEIDEVKSYQRDAYPETELLFWPDDPAGRPAPDSVPFSSNQVVFYYAPNLHLLWGEELAQKLFEYRLDTNPPRAARAYALVSIASYDASVANWNAKLHYMTARPNQFDPEITTILPTYSLPDYPSAHAASMGATAQVLSHLFPRDASFFQSRADENAASRMWAGIHFRSACEAGVLQGRQVGQAIVDYASGDGAE
jgi:membrane-associated phospholipid phosphatase